jgi:hypothetical protein
MLSLKFVKISVDVIDATVYSNAGEKNVRTERI